MTGTDSRRAGGLGAVALVATAIAVAAVVHSTRTPAPATTATPPPRMQWYTALAAPGPAATGTHTSACGVRIGPGTLGIAHPVLPCGAELTMSYDGKQVTAPVVERGPKAPGREFDLTPALAAELGLRGTHAVRWRFAG